MRAGFPPPLSQQKAKGGDREQVRHEPDGPGKPQHNAVCGHRGKDECGQNKTRQPAARGRQIESPSCKPVEHGPRQEQQEEREGGQAAVVTVGQDGVCNVNQSRQSDGVLVGLQLEPPDRIPRNSVAVHEDHDDAVVVIVLAAAEVRQLAQVQE